MADTRHARGLLGGDPADGKFDCSVHGQIQMDAQKNRYLHLSLGADTAIARSIGDRPFVQGKRDGNQGGWHPLLLL